MAVELYRLEILVLSVGLFGMRPYWKRRFALGRLQDDTSLASLSAPQAKQASSSYHLRTNYILRLFVSGQFVKPNFGHGSGCKFFRTLLFLP